MLPYSRNMLHHFHLRLNYIAVINEIFLSGRSPTSSDALAMKDPQLPPPLPREYNFEPKKTAEETKKNILSSSTEEKVDSTPDNNRNDINAPTAIQSHIRGVGGWLSLLIAAMMIVTPMSSIG